MQLTASQKRFCLLIADERGSDWAPAVCLGARARPTQYAKFGTFRTVLQASLQRAATIVGPSHLAVTLLEEDRQFWRPSMWFVPPANRYVGESRAVGALCRAAALLAIADKWPSSIVTILPARCFVAHEWILNAALKAAVNYLPAVKEGVITFGMMDQAEGIDEDYLVVSRAQCGPGFTIQAVARRPVSWVARSLQERGAMVSSGIMIGHAHMFGAHIAKKCPDLARSLAEVRTSSARSEECRIPATLLRTVSPFALRSLRGQAPAMPQRVFRVSHCGWSGLKTPRAAARLGTLLANGTGAGYGQSNELTGLAEAGGYNFKESE